MHILPRYALQMQHRFMHHLLHKPFKVPVWDFMTGLVEMNQLLNPPFAAYQALPKEEILDIAKFVIPTIWQKTMVLQGFDPMSNEFVEFEFAKGRHTEEQPDKKSCNGDKS